MITANHFSLNRYAVRIRTLYIFGTILIAIVLIVFVLLWSVFPDEILQALKGLSKDGTFEPRTAAAIDAFPRIAFLSAVILGLPSLLLIFFARSRMKSSRSFMNFLIETFSDSKVRFISILVICVTNIFLWHTALYDFFSQDDFLFLEGTRNTFDSFLAFRRIFLDEGVVDHHYRPITTNLYFAINKVLFGLNPVGYHAVNVIFQTLNSLLVLLLILKLTERTLPSLLGALIYSTRGALYVSVFWASGFQDLGTTFFYVMSLLLYLDWRSGEKHLRFAGSIVFYCLALLSKESAVTFPLIVLFTELLFIKNGERNFSWVLGASNRILPYAIITLFYLILRSSLTGFASGAYSVEFSTHSALRFPVYLFWSVFALAELRRIDVIIGFLFWIMVFILLFWIILRRIRIRTRLIRFDTTSSETKAGVWGLVWFIITLSPILLLPARFCPYYLTLPLIGFSVSAAILVHKLFASSSSYRREFAGFLIVIMITVSGLTKLEIHAKHNGWIYTGGHMDALSHVYARKTLTNIKTLYPTFPAHSTLYFVDMENVDHWVGGDPLGVGFGRYPCYPSMIRVFYDNWTLRIEYVPEGVSVAEYVTLGKTKKSNMVPQNFEATGPVFVFLRQNTHFLEVTRSETGL